MADSTQGARGYDGKPTATPTDQRPQVKGEVRLEALRHLPASARQLGLLRLLCQVTDHEPPRVPVITFGEAMDLIETLTAELKALKGGVKEAGGA